MMNQKLVAKEKEVVELARARNTMDFNYKVLEQEKCFLKQQLESVLGSMKGSRKSTKSDSESSKTNE